MPSEMQLSEIFDALGDGLFVADAGGRYVDVNPAACAMLGGTRDEILALTFHDLLDPSEWPRLPDQIASLADGSVRRSEWLFRRRDGSTFKGELVGGMLSNGRFQSIVRDISDRVERERHEELLKREASHRTKNVLAVVQAVARQTAASSPARFIETFEERIAALSASHDLFVKSAWGQIGLRSLVEAQLSPFLGRGTDRLVVGGPDIFLSQTAAQSVGMALHELATNAGKYGALSDGAGKVLIEWAVEHGKGAPDFCFSWREVDGPPVTQPTRTGFGTRMIAMMTERALGAKAAMDYEPGGLMWSMRCSLEALTDE